MNKAPDGSASQTCYLHIGPHKTGTSSIQRMLKKQGVRIGRAGVHVATTEQVGSGVKSNHSHLASRENFGSGSSLDLAPDWKLLSDDIAKHTGPIVISGENLYERVRRTEDYEQIVAFFLTRGFRLVFIAYVRDQVGWINSHFAQHLKNFRPPIPFKRYVSRALETGQFEFETMLANPLADERVSLEVVSFEQAVKTGLERDFLDRIGVRGVKPRPKRIANPNFGAKAAFIARKVIKASARDLKSDPQLRVALDQTLRRTALQRGWSQEPFMGFDDQSARAVREHYQPSNDVFAQRFFGAGWDETAPRKTVSRTIFDPAAASPEDCAEVDEVTEMLCKMIADASPSAG